MKGKVILSLAGLSVVVSLFKIQSISYHKQIEKLQSDLADAQIKNQILQSDLKECKQVEENFKTRNDKLFAELVKDFNNFKKGGN
jgi:polyhydroxyalkanoate synthesis regulator protein